MLSIEDAQIDDAGTYECSSGLEAQAFVEVVVHRK